ncbi:MAG: MBL fold metallo-hydrolase [Bdellovibrionales bacterium]
MKVTVLGCGSSGGVPLIGGRWGDCDPDNPRNRRTRASILVENDDTTILVDTSPDMRQQLLSCGLKKLDAVLYTHAHADHCHGIDELRGVMWLIQKPIDIYADPMTMLQLNKGFGYIFNGSGLYKPVVTQHEITGDFTIGSIVVRPFYQNHGTIRSLGFRFGDFAYSTDVHDFDATAVETLRGVKTWILDCVREKAHPTHLNVNEALKWIGAIKPERAYLTHLNHTIDYDRLARILPDGILPAHDGLVINC